jgi:ferredoxin-NADP reductase
MRSLRGPLLRAAHSAAAAAASPPRAEHLALTARSPRSAHWTACVLALVQDATPTVRLLRLRPLLRSSDLAAHAQCAALLPDLPLAPPAAPFSFRSGQWIDLAIPGIPQVGGYTLVSPPSAAASAGIDIAVKRARHPPAAWVHGPAAREGALVAVRVGGDFTLASLPAPYDRLVLLAGGVGVNPLYCMLLELSSSSSSSSSSARRAARRIDLLYLARTREELLFAAELQALGASGGALAGVLHLHLLTTRDGAAGAAPAGAAREGRAALAAGLVAAACSGAAGGSAGVGVLVCGPPSFSESMISAAAGGGALPEHVHCERWW